MTKWVDYFNVNICGREDNAVLKGLNKIPLCNRLMLCMKLQRQIADTHVSNTKAVY